MENNNNEQNYLNQKKELEDLVNSYSIEDISSDSGKDISSNSKKQLNQNRDLDNNFSSSKVSKNNDNKKSSKDEFIDISSSSVGDFNNPESSKHIRQPQKRSNLPQNNNGQASEENISRNRNLNKQVQNSKVYDSEKYLPHQNLKSEKTSLKGVISPVVNKFSKRNEKYSDDANAPRYKGEVYFSSHTPNSKETFVPKTNNKKRKKANKLTITRVIRKPKGRKRTKAEKKVLLGYLSIMLVLIIGLSYYGMSCLNDVLGFVKNDKVISVSIPKDATTNKIISILHKKKLINNSLFCKAFINATMNFGNKKSEEYIDGIYGLKADMGIENMLKRFRPTRSAKTVMLSFPEGWTIDKIANKLDENKVCTKRDFYENLKRTDYDYKFVKDARSQKGRYHDLEGYLFPNTYEFFVGENPSSVVKKMLSQFNTKWNSNYKGRAKQLGMTTDEVIILASLIQKEAGSISQMKKISSVFHNRLNNSSKFPTLQSDASANYVTNCIKYSISSKEYDIYLKRYNTYNCTGLPAGAICNPGKSAIEAALYPEKTDYWYFCHNTKTKKLYLAKTLKEHNVNKVKAELADK